MPDDLESKHGRTLTFDQWKRSTGYNPRTRTYQRTAQDNAPRAVPGVHRQDPAGQKSRRRYRGK